ncbi:MAG: heme-binding domain-containing protein [Fibrobacteria bacterium]|nr:heme-binding domain-containing protein [Fibrobacteria bacterium]
MKIRPLPALAIAAGLALAAQAFRPDRTNPAVVAEPSWDSPRTRALAQRACFDCHSHETIWPWYSNLAPASWLVAHHVEEGREHLNFSAIDGSENVRKMIKEIRSHDMPTPDYRLMHASARLTEAERDSLVAGLERTFAPHLEPATPVEEHGDLVLPGSPATGIPPQGVTRPLAGAENPVPGL